MSVLYEILSLRNTKQLLEFPSWQGVFEMILGTPSGSDFWKTVGRRWLELSQKTRLDGYMLAWSALVRVLQRNRIGRLEREQEGERERERKRMRTDWFKKLAHPIVGTGKSELCRVGHRTGNSGAVDVVASSPRPAGWKFGQGFSVTLLRWGRILSLGTLKPLLWSLATVWSVICLTQSQLI